ncbi:hypothetical protein PR202_ga24494 [Eleusine coracana subsp. coracana]|uniref:Uncharacterized protein n=1 Tax=Eleusine coracana subsp. coracana TaxID=191504 RepID=A0AAV5D8H2_ELECO|nr:hypothetical protein PR202_ga24494 [Eleusine coracana subsp. coracana]
MASTWKGEAAWSDEVAAKGGHGVCGDLAACACCDGEGWRLLYALWGSGSRHQQCFCWNVALLLVEGNNVEEDGCKLKCRLTVRLRWR